MFGWFLKFCLKIYGLGYTPALVREYAFKMGGLLMIERLPMDGPAVWMAAPAGTRVRCKGTPCVGCFCPSTYGP